MYTCSARLKLRGPVSTLEPIRTTSKCANIGGELERS